MRPHKPDQVATAPTLVGTHGRAWKRDNAAARARYNVAEQDDAQISMWIVEAPAAHPFWHSYMVSLVHLRPMPDGRETILYHPDASHELVIFALDPEQPRQPSIDGAFPNLLHPANFAAQLIMASDEEAASRIEGAVSLILSGELSPDTDHLSKWRALFGDNMIRKEFR
jgi:hypothetical protein